MTDSVKHWAGRKELFSWAMYDFANSGYTTVVLTALFNAYFVAVVAGPASGLAPGRATFLWTLVIAAANAVVLLSAPVIGAIADVRACKKRFLLVTTIGCAGSTALLSLVGPGDILLAAVLVLLATIMFASGENLIAAFLPELAPPDRMGRVSGYGWSLGYVGGILSLVLCVAYVQYHSSKGGADGEAIPATMLITALLFALAAVPTFIGLTERAQRSSNASGWAIARQAWGRISTTLAQRHHFRDLFRLLLTICIYQSGVITVVVLAAVYAQDVFGFDTQQLLIMILVVNITSAIGAFLFGFFQDRIGSKAALLTSLSLWVIAITLALFAEHEAQLWLISNLIGLAMGASQSIGRALVGQFTPPGRSAEFFGLWGLSQRLAAILGPLSYGLISELTGGDQRLALSSTLVFLAAGMVLLMSVNVERGRQAIDTV